MTEEIIPPEKVLAPESQSIGILGSMMSAIGICLLTLSFVGSFLFATVWAFSYLLGLPVWLTYPLYAVVALVTLWATIWATGRAWHVEKLIESGRDIDPPRSDALYYYRKQSDT